MRLPERLEPPAQVTVCEMCLRAGCWQNLEHCFGVVEGRPRTYLALTAEEVTDLNFEAPSFWHGPRAADQAPRDLIELLDVVRYESTRPSASRHLTREHLVAALGIDADQVDAALAQVWPIRRAS